MVTGRLLTLARTVTERPRLTIALLVVLLALTVDPAAATECTDCVGTFENGAANSGP
jgi:hypothetical protein